MRKSAASVIAFLEVLLVLLHLLLLLLVRIWIAPKKKRETSIMLLRERQ